MMRTTLTAVEKSVLRLARTLGNDYAVCLMRHELRRIDAAPADAQEMDSTSTSSTSTSSSVMAVEPQQQHVPG